MFIKDQVAVLIGGANGIGKAYAKELLERGAKIYIGDINDKEGENTLKELKEMYPDANVEYQHCDIIKDDDIKALFKKAEETFGKVKIFVNSTGELHEFNWQPTVDVNYGGVIRSSVIALSFMGKNNGGEGGVIVHTSSRAGLGGAVYSPVYAGTKAAVIWYCRSYALPDHFELTGVRFNVVAPCIVDTDFVRKNAPGRTHFAEKWQSEAPGMVTPMQCANGLVKLIEDEKLNGDVMVCSSQKGNFLDPQNKDMIKLH